MDTARQLAEQATRLYRGDGSLGARLQRWRPYICPFEKIIPLIPRRANVLDAGCGAGLFLGLLAARGRIERGVGFDASATAVAVARRMCTNLGPKPIITIQHIDALTPWPDETFDVVSLIDVLHHVPPTAQLDVLDRARRCVRLGGLLIYKDMAMKPTWQALANRAHDLLMARQWIHYLPISSVDAWAESNGLLLVEKGQASRYWYAHEWRVFKRP